MAYGTRRFNAAFTRALQYSLSWTESTRFLVLLAISLRSILILSSHVRLGFPKDLFSVGLSIKIFKEILPSFIQATSPTHLNLLDLITMTIFGEQYKLWSSSLWSLRHSPFSSLLGPNRSAFKILRSKPTGKRPLGMPWRRWEDNIRMNLEEIGINAGNWVYSAQDRDCWRALVNAILNLRVS